MQSSRILSKRRIGWGITILLVVLLWALLSTEELPTAQWTYPTQGSLVETVPANGHLRPLTEVTLSPDVSGEIIALYVREGDWVQQGTLLLKIRQDIYLSAVDQAEAALQATQAQLRQEIFLFEQHQRQYERSKMLFEQGSISKVEFENAEADYRLSECRLETAEHNVASATAMRNEAKENLQKTLVYAPIEGIISRLSVEQGERVVGTSQMAGTEMLRIADFRRMEVRVEVNENDILKIHLGDTARVAVDAYPDRTFVGVVTHLANSARGYDYQSGTSLPTFQIRVSLLPDSYEDLSWEQTFRPGMSASIEIETCHRNDILTLPLSCFVQRPGIRQACVFVAQENGQVLLRNVKTGIQDLSHIEIVEGIQPTDKVLTGPYSLIHDSLNDGDFVSLQHE